MLFVLFSTPLVHAQASASSTSNSNSGSDSGEGTQHDPVSSSGAGRGSDDADGLTMRELKRVELIKRLEMQGVPAGAFLS